MLKVLIIVDVPNWSYHTIAKGIQKYQQDSGISLTIMHLKGNEDEIKKCHAKFDLVFPMGWQFVVHPKKLPWLFNKTIYRRKMNFLDKKRTITGIHSHRAWDEGKSLPENYPLPSRPLVQCLSQFSGINAVSKRLYQCFKHKGLRNLQLTENGVDCELFQPKKSINTSRRQNLVVGFSGSTKNPKHDDLKGVSKFIKPLEKLEGIEVKLAIGSQGAKIPLEQMPDYYNSIDLYLCTSTSEGFSQSMLEAAACGRPVVSTRVGGAEDLIQDQNNGLLVERDYEKIKAAIQRLEKDRDQVANMGENMRKHVSSHYGWDKQANAWTQFMTQAAQHQLN